MDTGIIELLIYTLQNSKKYKSRTYLWDFTQLGFSVTDEAIAKTPNNIVFEYTSNKEKTHIIFKLDNLWYRGNYEGLDLKETLVSGRFYPVIPAEDIDKKEYQAKFKEFTERILNSEGIQR